MSLITGLLYLQVMNGEDGHFEAFKVIVESLSSSKMSVYTGDVVSRKAFGTRICV